MQNPPAGRNYPAEGDERENAMLSFAEEFDRCRGRQKTSLSAAQNQFAHGLLAFLAVRKGPFVDVHSDELIREIGIHLTSKLHGVVQGFFAVLEPVRDTVANRLGDLPAEFLPQRAAHGIPAQREGQASLFLPPDTEVEYPVESHLGEEELPFVNEQASLDHILVNGVDDFVEGHHHGFKVRLVEFEGEIGRGFQARYRNALARKLSRLKGLGGNDDGAVALTETGATIEQDVFVAESGIGSKADGGDVVRFS